MSETFFVPYHHDPVLFFLDGTSMELRTYSGLQLCHAENHWLNGNLGHCEHSWLPCEPPRWWSKCSAAGADHSLNYWDQYVQAVWRATRVKRKKKKGAAVTERMEWSVRRWKGRGYVAFFGNHLCNKDKIGTKTRTRKPESRWKHRGWDVGLKRRSVYATELKEYQGD